MTETRITREQLYEKMRSGKLLATCRDDLTLLNEEIQNINNKIENIYKNTVCGASIDDINSIKRSIKILQEKTDVNDELTLSTSEKLLKIENDISTVSACMEELFFYKGTVDSTEDTTQPLLETVKNIEQTIKKLDERIQKLEDVNIKPEQATVTKSCSIDVKKTILSLNSLKKQ